MTREKIHFADPFPPHQVLIAGLILKECTAYRQCGRKRCPRWRIRSMARYLMPYNDRRLRPSWSGRIFYEGPKNKKERRMLTCSLLWRQFSRPIMKEDVPSNTSQTTDYPRERELIVFELRGSLIDACCVLFFLFFLFPSVFKRFTIPFLCVWFYFILDKVHQVVTTSLKTLGRFLSMSICNCCAAVVPSSDL